MEAKYIEFFNDLLITPINNRDELEVWKAKATGILSRIYDPKCHQIEQVKGIKYYQRGSTGMIGGGTGFGDNINNCRNNAYGLARAIISELESFGLPQKPEAKSYDRGMHVSVNQNVEVNIKHVFTSALQEELTDKQFNEIKEIMDSPESEPTKRSKILDKIKSFGSDVVSNILANLLTNPQIFGG